MGVSSHASLTVQLPVVLESLNKFLIDNALFRVAACAILLATRIMKLVGNHNVCVERDVTLKVRFTTS